VIDVGQVLDKYELLERVGQGGMAVVYRGLDRSLRRTVAIKVLHRHLADHKEARDRFEREAHAVAKLRHENILEIFDYAASADESYIVTEFIEGATLKQYVTDHPPQHAEIGAMVVLQVCRALAHAHGQGILHRDVKPENVMIRSDGVVKLTDFGISQMLDLQRMTVTGQLLGSPAYMSPEHVEGRQLDFRTDVFAAGIVLYQLTVGKLPFEGKNPHEILKRIGECKYTDPRQANPRVGNELGKIILRAMARDPDDRFPDVTAMVSALERYCEGSGLGDPAKELARFFAAPPSYEIALQQRLIDHLTRRARALLVSKQTQPALELFDRVLTLDPKNAPVLALLDRMASKRRWMHVALAAGGLVLAAGGAWYARRVFTSPPMTQLEPNHAPIEDIGDTHGNVVIPGGPPDARTAIAIVTADAAPAVALVHHDAGHHPALVPDAGAQVTPPTGGSVTVRVSPTDSEVSIDGGPWRTYTDGVVPVTVGAAPIKVSARNGCCMDEAITVRPEDAGGPARGLALSYRPAYITAKCDTPGVGVEIDHQPATLGKVKTIPFGDTTQTSRSIEVDFILPDRIEPHTVDVTPAKMVDVRCDAR
jgi:serine/threonine protein kinase